MGYITREKNIKYCKYCAEDYPKEFMAEELQGGCLNLVNK